VHGGVAVETSIVKILRFVLSCIEDIFIVL